MPSMFTCRGKPPSLWAPGLIYGDSQFKIMKMSKPPKAFHCFLAGLGTGALIGLGQVTWYKSTDQIMKMWEPYFAFWALLGALTGLLVAAVASFRRTRT